MKHRFFCTCFDRNYLPLGMTLLRSLIGVCEDFTLFIAAMDEPCAELLEKLQCPQIRVVRIAEIESFDPDFAATKANRSRVEYYFTLSPVLPRFLLDKFPEIDVLGYLDSDLFFYSSPESLFEELERTGKDVLITPHRFPEAIRYREKFGKYNVSMQLYRRSANTSMLLDDWREKCIDWCYDVVEETRFADQKYLNVWPEQFPFTGVCMLPGAGVAPWNWCNYHYSFADDNRCLVDGEALIFYHFQGCKLLGAHLLQHNQGHYAKVMPQKLLTFFYRNYFAELQKSVDFLQKHFPAETFRLPTGGGRTGMGKLRAVASAIYHRSLMIV